MKEFEIMQVVAAPLELAYEGFTKAEHFKHWWGAKDSSIEVAKLELEPGGIFLYSMTLPDGNKVWGRFKFETISAPNCVTFTSSFSDENGGIARHFMSDSWPLEVLNTWEMKEADGKTTIKMRFHPINAAENEVAVFESAFPYLEQGLHSTLERFDEYLQSIQ
jgi:uncharacterized protein YndB with AHSA1/START domain